MLMLRPRFNLQTLAPLLASPRPSPSSSSLSVLLRRRRRPLSSSALRPDPSDAAAAAAAAAAAPPKSKAAPPPGVVRTALFVPPGVPRDAGAAEMVVLPGSNIVVGPYAGDARIREVEFAKSSPRARDCPRDDRPEFAVIGRSNVGKSSLINALVRKKDVALTSKKPGKTQLINHFLINKSWYIVDLPGYGFANAPESARMDWSSFTKGYFLNRNTLVGVLLLIDASVPPSKSTSIVLIGSVIGLTFVFTKCDKVKSAKGRRPDENIKHFQDLISKYYKDPPPWIMTSSVTGLGRDELLLHMSQLRNYWDNEAA
uniref:EngB-type G domain-containing protein n=1 Tax=Ananas comosus var. bracteatus TaxID=296719 RepID=A0A6V7QWV0_ANACO